MKLFLFVSFLSAILLGIAMEFKLAAPPSKGKRLPIFLIKYQREVKDSFQSPETANVLFSFIDGNKNGISPFTKKAFKRVNLSYLMSPGGLHFSIVLIMLNFFIKRIKNKRLRRFSKTGIISSVFFIGSLNFLIRSAVMKVLFQNKSKSKIKFSAESIFLLTFAICFILGQFTENPLSFIYSFAFIGTFISLSDRPKIVLILGLFSTQLILGLFMGEKVSLISIPLGLFGSFIFTFLYPLFLLFFMSFWLLEINWIEPIVRLYVVSIKIASKCLTGSFTSASVFLLLAMWVLMFLPRSQKKYVLLGLCLFLHTNTAMNPVIFS